MKRDGQNLSFWQKNNFDRTYQSDAIDDFHDIIIIGGGITGISTALELQRRGKQCLIIEQENLGFGTTGGTTSHINNFLDTSYAELINQIGEEKSKSVLNAALKVLPYIKNNIQKLHIACEFNECDFYLFSAEEKQDSELEDILKAHQQLGLETKNIFSLPFDINFRKVILIEGQGQFNPIKYIHGLAKEFLALGGKIMDHTKFLDYERKEKSILIKTTNGDYESVKLIFATHIPPGNSRYRLLCAPYRSYALTASLEHPPKTVAQSADLYDPYHYFRYHKDGDQYYLIVGGFDHKTGQQDPNDSFAELENYVAENFNYNEILYRWSSQFFTPADGLPYIGLMAGEEDVYVATGFDGNGMTWGTISAFIIPDLIDGKESDISKIVDPRRINIVDSAKSLITENVKNALHIVEDSLTSTPDEKEVILSQGSGAIIKHEDETVAAYCDDKGKVHYLSPKCPHMGCQVVFNSSEKSWDCPCHGSRFDIEGNLLTGPATKNLEKIFAKKP